jgi:hypothetical protein
MKLLIILAIAVVCVLSNPVEEKVNGFHTLPFDRYWTIEEVSS